MFRNILHHDVGIPSVFCFTDDVSEPARCTRQFFPPTSADSLAVEVVALSVGFLLDDS